MKCREVLKFNEFVSESNNIEDDSFDLENLTNSNRDIRAKKSADKDMMDDMPGFFEDPYENQGAFPLLSRKRYPASGLNRSVEVKN